MDTKHEALELADFLERDHRNWHSRAPQVLRRQHQRIEELEKALWQARFCITELLPGNRDADFTLQVIHRSLLSTTQQEDSQA